MKKVISTLLFTFLIAMTASAQSRDFDGLWQGVMTKDDGEKFTLTLFIEDNNVYSVTTDEDDDLVKNRNKEVSVSKGYGEQLNFFWIDKGGAWTETHMYSISWSSSSELSVHMIRHVSNEKESGNGNTDWGYSAKGVLE